MVIDEVVICMARSGVHELIVLSADAKQSCHWRRADRSVSLSPLCHAVFERGLMFGSVFCNDRLIILNTLSGRESSRINESSRVFVIRAFAEQNR